MTDEVGSGVGFGGGGEVLTSVWVQGANEDTTETGRPQIQRQE